ncbi:MAG: protein-L-isoaspartate(D-aspartate) O-methyltransferase [Candidatus Omnitrophota bacterium]
MTDYNKQRFQMVDDQICCRGIVNKSVLRAMKEVPRHLFVPRFQRQYAYHDRPLSIGKDQTISQPYMVALMSELLNVNADSKVLEIGTGSGYQTAVLCSLGAKVFSVERIGVLAKKAKEILNSRGYTFDMKVADGTLGWPEYAPYDRIIVAAGASAIPPALIEQLESPGIMVIPVGERFHQDLIVVNKDAHGCVKQERAGGCIFVPLISEENAK